MNSRRRIVPQGLFAKRASDQEFTTGDTGTATARRDIAILAGW